MTPFETLQPMNEPLKYMDWVDRWNELHCECVEAGMTGSERNAYMASWLEHILPQAKTLYYKGGKSPICDDRFDQFEGYLKLLKPESTYFKKVGYEIPLPPPPPSKPLPLPPLPSLK